MNFFWFVKSMILSNLTEIFPLFIRCGLLAKALYLAG